MTTASPTSPTFSFPADILHSPCFLSEASEMKTKGVGTIDIVKCGMNRDGNYFFADSILDSADVFTGVKMYANHPGPWDTERDVKDEIGVVTQAWANRAEKKIQGKIFTFDPCMQEKFAALSAAGLADKAEFSIFCKYSGKDSVPMDEGDMKHRIVESFIKHPANSVDHVWQGAAGGLLQVAASANLNPNSNKGENEMDLKELQAKYDSVAAELATLKQSSAENALKAENETLKQQVTKLVNDQIRAKAEAVIQASELPDAGKKRVIASLPSDCTEEKAKELVVQEADYLKSLGVQKTAQAAKAEGGVKGLGVAETATAGAPSNSDQIKQAKKRLFDSAVSEKLAQGMPLAQAQSYARIFSGYSEAA